MKSLCLLLVLPFTAVKAQGRWLPISYSKPDTVFFDTLTVAHAGDHHRVWTKEHYALPHHFQPNDGRTITYDAVKTLTEVDCTLHKLRDLKEVMFYENEDVYSWSGDNSYGQWDSPIPDSIGEVILNAICKRYSSSAPGP